MTVTPGLARLFSWAILDRVADQAADMTLALWTLRREIPEPEFLPSIATRLGSVVMWAGGVGWNFGDQDFDEPIDGLPEFLLPDVPTTYRLPADDFEVKAAPAPDPGEPFDIEGFERRMMKALRTIDAEPEPEPRVERLARDEAVQAAQYGYQDALRSRAHDEPKAGIEGYRRGTNPDCCELCFWLWKEGYVYPIDQPMHRHTGCRCWPIPTTDEVGRHRLGSVDQQRLSDYMDKYDRKKKKETS